MKHLKLKLKEVCKKIRLCFGKTETEISSELVLKAIFLENSGRETLYYTRRTKPSGPNPGT